MEYEVALPPNLGLSPEEFATAWNESSERRAVAEARVAPPPATQYNPALLGGALVIFGNLALGVAAGLLHDLINDALSERGIRKRTEIMEMTQPDGTHLLVVTIVEEQA
jgi:hypothetical protein